MVGVEVEAEVEAKVEVEAEIEDPRTSICAFEFRPSLGVIAIPCFYLPLDVFSRFHFLILISISSYSFFSLHFSASNDNHS